MGMDSYLCSLGYAFYMLSNLVIPCFILSLNLVSHFSALHCFPSFVVLALSVSCSIFCKYVEVKCDE